MPKAITQLFARYLALLAVTILVQGCFLYDRPPPLRAPLDKIWEEWMLVGKSAHWVNGHEEPWLIEMRNTIADSPVGAEMTKHAIVVEFRGQFGQGSWYVAGGLIGRADLPSASIELFGKGIIREHGLGYARLDEDYQYEFFLVVRPRSAGRGRILRRWTFPPEEVALAVPRETAARMRELAKSEKEAIKLIKQQRSHYLVAGNLRVEPTGPTAIVAILGMVEPVEERIDLSVELQ